MSALCNRCGAAIGGRKRCGITEHRIQIKAMQKWCAFLELRANRDWLDREKLRLELAEARRELADKRLAQGALPLEMGA